MTKLLLSWSCSLLLSATIASQPSAPIPVAAPMRPLPWGSLNFLHTTDTHGWLAGHLQEAQYSADWGDYISFAQRMKEKANEENVDLLLIDTGDRVEGNGLYDASNPKGKFTYDIFREQHMDVLTPGNHELYQLNTAAREYNQIVPTFEGSYLASNLDYIDPTSGEQVPMAPRFRRFTTKNQGVRVLAFGFLFDFKRNANNTVVQPVEETIKKNWFEQAIREDVDLFLVAGHVPLDGPEYKAIFKAIRSQNWDTPIQFFGGHSHIRDFVKYDAKAYGMQSGRYMETVGWVSMTGVVGRGNKEASKLGLGQNSAITVERRYIDNNLFGFRYHTDTDEPTFHTDHGRNVSCAINEARKALGLDQIHGCAPRDLSLSRVKYPSEHSILSWLNEEVAPDVIKNNGRQNVPRIALINSGSLRFDLFKGPFSRDTAYIISPFKSRFLYLKDVTFASAQKVGKIINNNMPFASDLNLPTSPPVVDDELSPKPAELPVLQYATNGEGTQSRFLDNEPDLFPGYTTKDDAGNDGDDTIHSSITFYRVPNCLESRISFPDDEEPEVVDLVFLDFIQPWVIRALEYLGEDYTSDDVEVYTEDTMTTLMTSWIQEHWDQNC